MAKKKPINKKKKPAKPVNPPTPAAQAEDINAVIKAADSVVLITEKRGNIEVRALKNISYAWQVKGLLLGALDKYLVTPINGTLRQMNDSHINLYKQILVALKEAAGGEEDVKEEEKKS